LAWALMPANRRNDRIYFPIYYADPRPGAPFRPKSLAGMDPDALALIETCQPYYGGKNPDLDFLWFVKELSNTDKHRTINIVVGQTTITALHLYMTFDDEEPRELAPSRLAYKEVLQHGSEVAAFPLSALKGGSEVKVVANVMGFITFGPALPWGIAPVGYQLGQAWLYIKDSVLPRFDRFF
jgi:hypothetical protein